MSFDEIWTKTLVETRVLDGARLCQRIVKTVGPQAFGNSMPDYLQETGDLNSQQESGELEKTLKEANQIRIMASARDVTRMDRAMRWPAIYLKEHGGCRTVLRAWLRCKIFKRRFGAAIKRNNWSHATAYRRRDEAFEIIAAGLNRDRVPVD